MKEISLIFPVYNEEESIKLAIDKSSAILKKNFKSFEIIAINDASTDKSGQILDTLKSKRPYLRVIHNAINLGQGLTLLIGFKQAAGRLITHNGVDLPFDLNYLPELVKYIPEYDIVVVERLDRSAYSLWRKITSMANNILRWILFSRKYRDLNFVQIYKREVLEHIRVHSKGGTMITQELILKSERAGYKIITVKSLYLRRKMGQANHGKSHDILIAVAEILNYWLHRKDKIEAKKN